MTNYLFTGNEQGWSVDDYDWTGVEGSPGLGCLFSSANDSVTSITGLSIPIVEGDPFSCRARVTHDGIDGLDGEVTITFTLLGPPDIDTVSGPYTITQGLASDTGWFVINGISEVSQEITGVQFRASGNNVDVIFTAYVDSVYVAETEVSAFYGVWQDGLIATYNNPLGNVILGTHVGNALHVVRGTYDPPFAFRDYTYNLETCESYTASYIASYGATYAAVFYQDIACNVRALEWV